MKWRLVDKILAWTPNERITGVKSVSFEEYSLKDAFGGDAHLPESLLLESFMQLGNWLILLSSDFNEMGMVIRIAEVRFLQPLLPAQQVQMDVQLVRRRNDGFELSGEGKVNGQPIITGLGCLAVPLAVKEYVDPEDLRVVFSEIYQPQIDDQ